MSLRRRTRGKTEPAQKKSSEGYRVRQITTMKSPDVEIKGEPVCLQTLFNNKIFNNNMLRKHKSLINYSKTNAYASTTEQWSQSVNRYLETYSLIKKGKPLQDKACDGVIHNSNKQATLINFHRTKNSLRYRTVESEDDGKCNFKTVIDNFWKPLKPNKNGNSFLLNPESIYIKECPLHELKTFSFQKESSKKLYYNYFEDKWRKKEAATRQQAPKKSNIMSGFSNHSFLLSNDKKPQHTIITIPKKKVKQPSGTDNYSCGLKKRLLKSEIEEWEDKQKLEPWNTQPNSINPW